MLATLAIFGAGVAIAWYFDKSKLAAAQASAANQIDVNYVNSLPANAA